MPLYWRVRGAISAPLESGLLKQLLSVADEVVLLCGLLGLASPYLIAISCAVPVVLSPSVLSIFAGSIHTADAAFLAFLLASCARCLLSARARSTLLGAASWPPPGAGSFISPFFLGVSAIVWFSPLRKRMIRARSSAASSTFCSAPRSHGGVSGRLMLAPPPRRT